MGSTLFSLLTQSRYAVQVHRPARGLAISVPTRRKVKKESTPFSRGPQGEALVVLGLAAVVVGLDGKDPVLLLVDPTALVGDGDDVVELLVDVGGDDEIATRSLP
jgi:hypothetical protein